MNVNYMSLAKLLQAAIEYEEAWDRYANPSKYPELTIPNTDRITEKAYAHKNLLDIVREIKGGN